MTGYGWAIMALWLFFLVVWFIASFKVKERTHGKDALQWLANRGVAIAAAAGFFHMQVFNWGSFTPAPNAPHPFVGVAGILVCAAGVAFAIWARIYLGLNWGMPMSEKKDPELITGGPYTLVRHPVYTGILLAMLGSALTLGEVWLSIFIVFLVYFLYASTQEERTMEQYFSHRYLEYKKRTKMLVPFLF